MPPGGWITSHLPKYSSTNSHFPPTLLSTSYYYAVLVLIRICPKSYFRDYYLDNCFLFSILWDEFHQLDRTNNMSFLFIRYWRKDSGYLEVFRMISLTFYTYRDNTISVTANDKNLQYDLQDNLINAFLSLACLKIHQPKRTYQF